MNRSIPGPATGWNPSDRSRPVPTWIELRRRIPSVGSSGKRLGPNPPRFDWQVDYCRPVYRLLFRVVLRRLPAEFTHNVAIMLLRIATRWPRVRASLERFLRPHDPVLRTQALGLEFDSPVGLAAGFDKDAQAFPALHTLGFGFIEVGTVTAYAQPGNPKPRLFRLPMDRALINRMGFNNEGALAVATRLERLRAAYPAALVGVNIGKTKRTPVSEVVEDYVYSAQVLIRHIDYLVVNVSSPNTPGLRDLETAPELEALLIAVRRAVKQSAPERSIPILLKISADLTVNQVNRIAEVANRRQVDGIIATNTSTMRGELRTNTDLVADYGQGGLSGPPLRTNSLDVLRRLKARIRPETVLISVGGIESAEDVLERILAGATLVQAYTGFVYGGPGWVSRLNRQLALLLRDHGFDNVNDAIGRSTVRQVE